MRSRPHAGREGRKGGASWAASRLGVGREERKAWAVPGFGLEREKENFSKINPFPFVVFKSKPNSNEI